jgi:large subunit ribosomal protein L25
MNELTVEVQKREATGKNANRRLRAAGVVPAVLYGGERDTVSIQVVRKEMIELLKKAGSEHPIFLLKLADSGQERHAMVRELKVHPITRILQHIDFQRILMTEKLRTSVPIEVVGIAYGVKTEGGLIDFVTREVQVECLPADIPRKIAVDVTALHIGQHLEARELELPKGVELLEDADRVIVSCSHTHAEQSTAGAEGLLEAVKAEPEVIKKKKPDEKEKKDKK